MGSYFPDKQNIQATGCSQLVLNHAFPKIIRPKSPFYRE